ncbi:hypothetical protein F5146DRAFT_1120774 [Armillaria mellea]|nr:hypothetical protein F5146DRAFT_1120774 [Armillaria mellea]
MPAHISSTIFIPAPSPHPGEPTAIHGILEQLEPKKSTQGRKLALPVQWDLSVNNPTIIRHKDHLFLKQLASTLPMDTFCFDFRYPFGIHFFIYGIAQHFDIPEDTLSPLRYGVRKKWKKNLRIVTDYLKVHFGCQIDLVIGHSRGAVLAIRWLCTSEDGKQDSGFRIRDYVCDVPYESEYTSVDIYVFQSSKIVLKTIADKGFHLLNRCTFTHAFKEKIYEEDFVDHAAFDNSFATDVLIVHGIKDEGYNAALYAKALSKRSPGTHSLHFMEHADHTYMGQHAEVVQTILDWWESHSKDRFGLGIWMGPDIKVKVKL